MNFREAFDAMKHGKKVKLPWWDGYWAWEHGDIIMHCRDGVARSIMESELPEFTYMNIASDEFEIVKEENDEKSVSHKNTNSTMYFQYVDYLGNSGIIKLDPDDSIQEETHTFNFTRARMYLENGKRVGRKAWNDKEGTTKYLELKNCGNEKYLYLCEYGKTKISQSLYDLKTSLDIMADDWILID